MLPGCGEGVGHLTWDLKSPLSPQNTQNWGSGCWKNSGKANPALPGATGTSVPWEKRSQKILLLGLGALTTQTEQGTESAAPSPAWLLG